MKKKFQEDYLFNFRYKEKIFRFIHLKSPFIANGGNSVFWIKFKSDTNYVSDVFDWDRKKDFILKNSCQVNHSEPKRSLTVHYLRYDVHIQRQTISSFYAMKLWFYLDYWFFIQPGRIVCRKPKRIQLRGLRSKRWVIVKSKVWWSRCVQQWR